MDLIKIIDENPDINLTVKGRDLLEANKVLANNAVKIYIERHDEKVYSRKEVTEKFGICDTSLWRWQRLGLIEYKKIGNRVFFPESSIKQLISQKGGQK